MMSSKLARLQFLITIGISDDLRAAHPPSFEQGLLQHASYTTKRNNFQRRATQSLLSEVLWVAELRSQSAYVAFSQPSQPTWAQPSRPQECLMTRHGQ
eukprot:4116970-Amphidinium_carterae.1